MFKYQTTAINYRIARISREIEAHERLSSTRETIETSVGHIVKKFSVLFLKILLLRT